MTDNPTEEEILLALATLFGAELRNRSRSWLFVAFLVAIVSGTVLAGLAAGQRTASAYPRFVASHGFDAYAFSLHPIPGIASLPDVTSSVLMRSPSAGDPSCSCGRTINPTYFGIAEIPPNNLGRFVKLVSGRLPRESKPTEVLASFSLAQDVGVGIGTRIRVPLAGSSPTAPTANGSTVAPGGPVVTLTVVGIEAADVEFQSSSYPYFDVFTTTAFAATLQPLDARPSRRISFAYVEASVIFPGSKPRLESSAHCRRRISIRPRRRMRRPFTRRRSGGGFSPAPQASSVSSSSFRPWHARRPWRVVTSSHSLLLGCPADNSSPLALSGPPSLLASGLSAVWPWPTDSRPWRLSEKPA